MATGHSKRPVLKEMGGYVRKFFNDLKKICCDIVKEYQEKRQKSAVVHKTTHAREEKHTKAPKTTAAKPKTAETHKKTTVKTAKKKEE